MGVLEIVLLLAGGILAALSFLLPVAKEEVPQETKSLAKDEIKNLVSQEMDSVRKHVDDVVDEAVGYAVEKTERSLERLTNEKIMAVNEYSDTVLQEIHKNHEEAMFLYDMLNQKHANLKNTVSEVNKTVQEVEETRREAEAVVTSFQQLKPDADPGEPARKEWDFLEERKAEFERGGAEKEPQEAPKSAASSKNARRKTESGQKTGPEGKVPLTESSSGADLNFMTEGQPDGTNNKEQILALYRQGKSTIAIARELGLGVGEVKLVIDLNRNL